MKIIATALMILLWVVAPSWGQDQLGGPKPCREHPQVNSPCFTVHGRMRLYNGTPCVRIWPIGTHRILGVSENRFYNAEYANLPPELSKLLRGENEIFADFIVCPFMPDEPGVMRLVCVDSASNIVVRKIPRK